MENLKFQILGQDICKKTSPTGENGQSKVNFLLQLWFSNFCFSEEQERNAKGESEQPNGTVNGH